MNTAQGVPKEKHFCNAILKAKYWFLLNKISYSNFKKAFLYNSLYLNYEVKIFVFKF